VIGGGLYVLLGLTLAALGVRDILRSREPVTARKHVHHCPACDVAWAHRPDPKWTAEEFEAQHRCPKCATIAPEVAS
jgi:hypothetical protein